MLICCLSSTQKGLARRAETVDRPEQGGRGSMARSRLTWRGCRLWDCVRMMWLWGMTASQPKPQLAASLLGQTPAVVERCRAWWKSKWRRVSVFTAINTEAYIQACIEGHGSRKSIAPICTRPRWAWEKIQRARARYYASCLAVWWPKTSPHYPLPTICSPDTHLDKEISPASILTILSILSILSVTANRFSLRQQMLCSLRALAQLSGNTALWQSDFVWQSIFVRCFAFASSYRQHTLPTLPLPAAYQAAALQAGIDNPSCLLHRQACSNGALLHASPLLTLAAAGLNGTLLLFCRHGSSPWLRPLCPRPALPSKGPRIPTLEPRKRRVMPSKSCSSKWPKALSTSS